MNIRAVIVRLSLPGLLVLTACGAQAGEERFYVGGSAGISKADIDSANRERQLTALGLVNPVVDTDTRGHAAKAYAGWRLHRNLAIEGGVFTLRSYEVRSTVAGGSLHTETVTHGFNADAVGLWPVREDLLLLARVGAMSARGKTESESTGSVNVPRPTARETKLLWKIGLGAEWSFAGDFAARVEWERYRVPDGLGNRLDIDALTVGILRRF